MIEVYQETVKSPVGRKRFGNIKTAEVSNEKVVVQIIKKVGYHGKAFAFHNNKRADHGMAGKTFTPGGRVLPKG